MKQIWLKGETCQSCETSTFCTQDRKTAVWTADSQPTKQANTHHSLRLSGRTAASQPTKQANTHHSLRLSVAHMHKKNQTK